MRGANILGCLSGRSKESALVAKKDVAFVLANGQEVTRSVGFAIIRFDKFFTIDEIVFGEPGDLQLLGARTLEGLNLVIEPSRRRLVAAGPLPRSFAHKPAPESEHTTCCTQANSRLIRP
jgi:hypothetical protein